MVCFILVNSNFLLFTKSAYARPNYLICESIGSVFGVSSGVSLASNLLDGDTGTFWQASGSTASFSLALGGSRTIQQIRVYASGANANRITSIIVYDGSSFSSLGGMNFGQPAGWYDLAVGGLTGDELRFSVAASGQPSIYEIQICQPDVPTATPTRFFLTSTSTISLLATSVAQNHELISLQRQLLSATLVTTKESEIITQFPSGTISRFSWSLGFGDLLGFGSNIAIFGLATLYFITRLTNRL